MSILEDARRRSEESREVVKVTYQSRHADRDIEAALIQGKLAGGMKRNRDGEAIDWTWGDDGYLYIFGYDSTTPEKRIIWYLCVEIVNTNAS